MVDEATEFSTVIGKDSVFEGIIRGTGHHAISGLVVGECELDGILYIGVDGRWNGTINADVVIISGTVDGSVFAKSKIELSESGRMTGNLKAPAVAIAEGAAFDGKISMARKENITRFKERRGAEEENGKENKK